MNELRNSDPLGLRWLGQAGFEVKLEGGPILWIDPYLSDYVETELGFARMVPAPLDPHTTRVDCLVLTHWHFDHLDMPTCLAVAASSPDAVFVGPPSCVARLAGRGITRERLITLERGSAVSVCGATIHATFARHAVPGWLTEDAIGLAIEVGGVRLFHSGDTEYDSTCLDAGAYGPFDVGIFVGNGSGGNMSMREAALMAHQLDPRLAIPAHYGMWAREHYGVTATLDPGEFVEYCRRLHGPEAVALTHGETIRIPSGGEPATAGVAPRDQHES